jgi:hypothetical protein
MGPSGSRFFTSTWHAATVCELSRALHAHTGIVSRLMGRGTLKFVCYYPSGSSQEDEPYPHADRHGS